MWQTAIYASGERVLVYEHDDIIEYKAITQDEYYELENSGEMFDILAESIWRSKEAQK